MKKTTVSHTTLTYYWSTTKKLQAAQRRSSPSDNIIVVLLKRNLRVLQHGSYEQRGEPSLIKHCQCAWTPRSTTRPSVANHCKGACLLRQFSCLTHIGSVAPQARVGRISNFVNLNEIIVTQKRDDDSRTGKALLTKNRKPDTNFYTWNS